MTDSSSFAEKCSIFLEHQPLPDSYPLPFPGLTGYMAEITDLDMQDVWHVGFLGPTGLVPDVGSSDWDVGRALSWVALAIHEEPEDGVMEILGVIDRGVLDNSSTVLRVSGRKDVAGHVWPMGQSLEALSAPALADRQALRLAASLPPSDPAPAAGPRL